MPNFNPYSCTPSDAATVTVPQYTIATTVFDDGNVLVADYTGDAALVFPQCLSLLSQDVRDALMANWGEQVAGILAGVFTP